MQAKLLFPTREIAEQYYLPLIYTACRTCYSELEPQDIFERATTGQVATDKQQDLIRRVIESGHGSTIEHIVFTFAISGVTRTLSHQLVRHRAGVAFDQQSQRYLNYKRPSYMVPGSLADAPAEMRERFVVGDGRLARVLRRDARGRHPGRGRALRDAQRDAHQPDHDRQPALADPHVRPAPVHDGPVGDPPALPADPPRGLQRLARSSGSFLAPKCVPLGYCDEDRNRDEHCPIRPHKDNVLAAWAEKKAAAKAAGRELPTL